MSRRQDRIADKSDRFDSRVFPHEAEDAVRADEDATRDEKIEAIARAIYDVALGEISPEENQEMAEAAYEAQLKVSRA